jgi:transposase
MKSNFYQLILPLNLEIKIPEDDPVRLLNDICDELDYSNLYKSYCRAWRKYDPVTLFKIIVYGYMNEKYSCRDLEGACKRDICFMWLLNGLSVPDSATFARFQNERLVEVIEDLFYQFINKLAQMNEVRFKNIFVDGTKIEANANKYTFVWKKAIEKYSAKLTQKSLERIAEIKTYYGLNEQLGLQECIEELNKQASLERVAFVYGKGKHKTALQKHIEYLTETAKKQGEYGKYLQLMGGDRNSLSKTDTDATFMRMKEDYMRNGQLKPAYNIQIGVESEYIVGISSHTDRSDVQTLIPFLERIRKHTDKSFRNVIADAGYESEENYTYLMEHKQTSYIKPTNYEISKTRKYKSDLYNIENMRYDEATDSFTCVNGEQLYFTYKREVKTKNGYTVEQRYYRTTSCAQCPNRNKCYKSKRDYKEIKVSLRFLEQRKRSLANIISETGTKLRMNRSIQVEGAFGVIKQDMSFRRFLTRGKRKTETQFFLLAFAFNILKLKFRQENARFGKDLFELKQAA